MKLVRPPRMTERTLSVPRCVIRAEYYYLERSNTPESLLGEEKVQHDPPFFLGQINWVLGMSPNMFLVLHLTKKPTWAFRVKHLRLRSSLFIQSSQKRKHYEDCLACSNPARQRKFPNDPGRTKIAKRYRVKVS
jgi:hypothetical protein